MVMAVLKMEGEGICGGYISQLEELIVRELQLEQMLNCKKFGLLKLRIVFGQSKVISWNS